MTDLELIAKIKAGDRAAFRLIVERYKNYAFTIALRILKNRELSEEVCQDSFLSVYQSISIFNFQSSFSTWLYRIVFNKAISETRKKGYKLEFTSIDSRENDDLVGNISLDSDELNQLQSQSETKAILDYAIQKLDEASALLITLYYFNDCTIEEIASITGFAKSNIKIILFRARKKLLATIKEYLGAEYEYWK